jgi:DNA (cytosine-5)-methyltransferase 1
MKLKHLDLFSGIGGFALGLQWAEGFETVAFCEIDKFCQKVLKKNFPGVPIYEDIKTFTYPSSIRCDRGKYQGEGIHGEELLCGEVGASIKPQIDLITGGFPCQPFSCAGKRRGKEDDRFLWPEMLRIIREAQPSWVIAENVRGLLSIDNGLVFENCCLALEGEGYEVQPFIIPACAVNAPHRRDRVWIVGHRLGESRRQETERRLGMAGYIFSEQRGKENPDRIDSPDCHVADTDQQRPQGWNQHGECAGEWFAWQDHTKQWQEDWYTVALRTCVRDLDDGLSGRLVGRDRVNKLKALGNAIVPQIAEILGRAIIGVEREGEG